MDLLKIIQGFLVDTGRPLYRLIWLGVEVIRKLVIVAGKEVIEVRKKVTRLKDWRERTKKVKRVRRMKRVEVRKSKEVKRIKKRRRIDGKGGSGVAKNWFYMFLTMILFLMSAGSGWFYKEILTDLPNINQIYYPPRLSSKILDKNGRLLYKFYQDENRSWTTIDRIPESLVWATIAIEDKNFYKHHGLSVKGIIKALWYNLKKERNEKLRGGSTITQQLVKNVFFGNEKNWERKIKEAVLTLILETKLSKDEILEQYFNQVAYGGETYGVQEASWKYFNRNVWEINTAQAAFLAGLPAAPSSYSPFGDYPYFAYLRQKHVIEEMRKAGYINDGMMMSLLEQEVEIEPEVKSIQAAHFVFWVKSLLEKDYGFRNFDRQGLTVTTSLDIDVQQMAEKIVKEEIAKVSGLRISNGAVMVVDVAAGEVLAMVGSKGYMTEDIDGKVNVTTRLRQPGSSIKPINYLLALQKGRTLMSVVDDSRVTYYIPGQKPYSPQNYNGKYMGKVTLKTALASSLNVPSVKLLAENGVEEMIDLAEKMGISTWQDRERFGIALALGAGEVKMVELAQAYAIFANMGKKKIINPVLRIENYLGETIYSDWSEEKQVVDARYAFLINEILSDNKARSPIFGWNSMLRIEGKTVAVKTGTTNNLRDNWSIGWTPSYLVAAWVGNNDSSPMSWVASGISGATPIWNRVMREMLAEKMEERWEVPNGIVKKKVCGKEEYFVAGTEKRVKCVPKASLTPSPGEGSD